MTVTFQENTLSEQTIADLFDHIDEIKEKFVWNSNMTFWPKGLVNTNGVVMSYKLPDEWYGRIFNELYARKKIPYMPKGGSVLFYAWYAGSSITWHRDYENKNSMTIYFNKGWNANDGGWFCWKDWDESFPKASNTNVHPEECRMRKPLYNHSVYMTGAEWHCTGITPPAAPVRYTLQMFFEKP